MEQLICRLASQKNNPYSLISEFQNLSPDDWSRLLQLCDFHKMKPVLYQFIRKQDLVDDIPPRHYKNLRDHVLLNSTRNILFLHEAESLIKAFQKANIPVIGLKGIYLIEHFYDNISLRSMNDIDLLLKKKNIPSAITIAESLGYHQTSYFDIGDQNIDTKHVPPLKKEDGPYLEIHWTILEEDEPFTIDANGFWDRAISTKIAGVDAKALSMEDLVLHLCIHLTYQHHLEIGLHSLYEIHLLIQQEQDTIDWKSLSNRAREWGAQRVIALSLKLMEDIFGTSIPQQAYKWLIPDPIPNWIIAQARTQLFTSDKLGVLMTPDLSELANKPGLFSIIQLVFSRVFLPKIIMSRIYNIPPNSLKIYFYYPIRFYQLIKYYSRSITQILKKEKGALQSITNMQSATHLKKWLIETNNQSG